MKHWGGGVLVLLVLACGEDVLTIAPAPPPPPPPNPVPTLAIVSGDGQIGTFGQFLAEALVIRVTDREGNGIGYVAVRWTIASGAGEFGSFAYTSTTTDGFASITFRPTWPSPATVIASSVGFQGPPAIFTERASGPAVVLIRFAPQFDCDDAHVYWDFYGDEVAIPMGAQVEWDLWCGGHLRSVSVPPGGTPFDSGPLTGQRFSVILDAAGEWKIEEVGTGKTATLRVR